jgi:glycosyltransferase 2 family protein
VLAAVHPRTLNPAIRLAGRLKKPKAKDNPDHEAENPAPAVLPIQHYPVMPLLGEVVFLGLRGAGFCFTVLALSAIAWDQVPVLVGAFSVAWLLGLIIPGAPGGIGVFEATAIALLDNHFPPAMVVSAVAVYRLVSLLAELAGAGMAWLYSRRI